MSLCNFHFFFSPPWFQKQVILCYFYYISPTTVKKLWLNFRLVEREVQIKEAADGPFVTE